MQKFDTRDTYTPTDISHVCSNCDQSLKDPREKVGVIDLKTVSNNPDATLTAKRHAEQDKTVPAVYVLNKDGNPLMPCKPQKAKKLLKQKKAKVVQKTPFTIKLLYHAGHNVQKINLGVDVGYIHVGLSAITDTKEVYVEEVILRKNVVSLNSERRQYRRSRRSRIWHRKPRFLNRKKESGWIAPSIKHKLDSHIRLIEKVRKILPIFEVIIEVASFNIQKIKNPDIKGEDYQKGCQLGFWNVREYILHRDNHLCRHCNGTFKDKVLNVHHIVSRKTGGDRPDNLITLCKTCHQKYHKGEIKLKTKTNLRFKKETFMTMIRWALINKLKTSFNTVSHTFGFITKYRRILLNLPKSHIADAFVIAGGSIQKRLSFPLFTKQVRNCNRKLFKGIRSHIKNTQDRFVHGFQRFDKVLYKGIKCFIFGRRKTGYFDLRKLNGLKIHASAKAKDCILLETFKTFLTERRIGVSSHS